MTGNCLHDEIMVHVFVETQVPYYLKRSKIDYSDIDDTPVIRPDMSVTCQQCGEDLWSFDDWREAPKGVRGLYAMVRKALVEEEGYIEGYPPEDDPDYANVHVERVEDDNDNVGEGD